MKLKKITLKLKNGETFLIDKEMILSSKKEMESLVNKLEYAVGSIVKRGNVKYYKIKEKKKIKK